MQAANDDSENGLRLSEALLAFARQRHVETSRIARLLSECEPFREICADYEECCARLSSLQQKGGTDGRQIRDYAEMRQDLELDLLKHLEACL